VEERHPSKVDVVGSIPTSGIFDYLNIIKKLELGMSIVQNIDIQCVTGKMAIRWDTIGECVAISLQIATDSEFTKNERCYVIPKINALDLDCGGGLWYIRIGSWIGDAKYGTVEWSGVYGPIAIASSKHAPPLKPSPVSIVHTQSIQKGLRFHTENLIPMYFVLESSVDRTFNSTTTKTQYVFDYGKGYIDCVNLSFGSFYSIRFGAFVTESLDKLEIRQLGEWQTVHNKQPARPNKPFNSTQVASEKADASLLREASQKKVIRFTSHSDYLRFKAAETRAREELN
jgi:hypothetical protein